MPQVKDAILRKALVCIDEVYPEANSLNAAFFPLEQFIDEAARFVVNAVPLRALGAGKEFDKSTLLASSDGSGSISLPPDFIRLLRFRIEGWQRPVVAAIYDTDIRYSQQFNKTLRGGNSKPVVVICRDLGRLEYYSSSRGSFAKIAESKYFGYSIMDDTYPLLLVDLTAWKLAELVLSSMNDVPAMQLCAAKVNENMQLL
ncbi:MAG: hypothetical protein RR330_05485 [Alistipes sp.]